MTGGGRVQGTAHYMSPEQIERRPDIDCRTDIFSFGAVLYEALCGHTAAGGARLHDVIESVKHEVPPPPSQRGGRPLPPLLEEVAMTCLQKSPERRYAAIDEVVTLLRRYRRKE